MIPFGEYLPDQPAYNNQGATVVDGVYPALQSYKPFKSFVATSTALTAQAQGAASFRDYMGAVYNFAGDASKLYKLVSTTWANISGATYVTPLDQRWRFAQFGNYIIASNSYDNPQYYDVATSTAFADLGGTAPKFRYMAVIKDFFVAGYVGVSARTVRWPSINTVDAWTTGVNQADSQILPSGGSIQGIAGGEYGIILQEYSIKRMTYVGAPIIFQFDEIEANHGCFEPNSIAQYGKMIFYLSHEGFYYCDGNQAIPIGDQKVDKTFFADVDEAYLYRMSVAIDPANKLVVWSYAGTGHTGGTPNKVLIYNWELNRWSPVTLTCELLYTSISGGSTLEGISVTYPNLDAMPLTMDSRVFLSGSLGLSAFNTSHSSGEFTGTNVAATIETGEAQLTPGRRAKIKWTTPIVDVSTATVQIGHRSSLNAAVTWTTAASQNSAGKCLTLLDDRYMRARVSIPAAATWTHAQGIEIEAAPGGAW